MSDPARLDILYADGSLSYVRLTRHEWQRTHRDFKQGRLDKDGRILALDPKTGGTCSVPVMLGVVCDECGRLVPAKVVCRHDGAWERETVTKKFVDSLPRSVIA